MTRTVDTATLGASVDEAAAYARQLTEICDTTTALAAWAAIRQEFPNHAAGYVGGADLLCALSRREEAEALIAQAQIFLPDDRAVAYTWGDLAVRSNDWTEAARRWLILQRCLPNEPRCISEAARALAELGEHVRSDILLTEGRKRFPNEFAFAFYWAEAAERDANLTEAVFRWAQLREQFPAISRVWIHSMRVVFDIGDQVGAEKLASQAVEMFPHDAGAIANAGDIAVRSSDFAKAAERYKLAAEQDPNSASIKSRHVSALLSLDRRVEALAVLDDAIAAWPLDRGFIDLRIKIALRDRAFDQALVTWSHLAEISGENSQVPTEIAMSIIRALPQKEVLAVLIDYLSLEHDDGTQNWLPAFTRLGDFFIQHGAALRQHILHHLALREAKIPQDIHLLWKALIGSPFTEMEMETCFKRHLACGRMPIVSTLFANFSFQFDPTAKQRTRMVFERFIACKLEARAWISLEQPLELLSYLTFAAVMSMEAGAALAQAGLERLDLRSIPNDAAPETAETALATMLRRMATSALPPTAGASLITRSRERLKIAMCVSGQLRGFQRALPTWSALGLGDHDVSTFVHTWNNTGRNWSRTWWFLRDYPALWQAVVDGNGLAFLQNRFPKLGAAVAAVIAEGMDVTTDALRSFYQTDHVVVEDDTVGAFRDKPNVWKMHYKIEQTQLMAAARMAPDTLYIRLRPDLGFGRCEPIDWDALRYESARHRLLHVDIPYAFVGNPGLLKLADAFLVGVREPMDAFAQVFSGQAALSNRGSTYFNGPAGLTSHATAAFASLYQGVATKKFDAASRSEFLEATILPIAQVLHLLHQDVGDHPKDQQAQHFLAACRHVIGPDSFPSELSVNDLVA